MAAARRNTRHSQSFTSQNKSPPRGDLLYQPAENLITFLLKIMTHLEYKKIYKEKEFIGRGNFGSATLVERIDTKCNYIAKKIILTSLNSKQQEAALQEASLLKNLHHKNIVAYVESFKEEELLIIVMEYCEHGDLGFHIKRKKQKKAYFPEMLIVNWFYELALAIKYIHERKILHRDIKTTNIFITKDGTIKIGDFGISKVLEHTTSVAKTVVGTPYYMSPEVCESKPYTYKSDIWALGCVLFELCSLEHAFESNNLLGLLFKIVKEEPPAIPNCYSKDLSNLISKLLKKDELERPTIQEILNDESTQKLLNQYLEARPETPSTTQQTKPTETSQIETISEESCATIDEQSSKENSLNSNGLVNGQNNTTGSSGSGTSAPLSVVDSQVFQLQYSQLAGFNKEETLNQLELKGQQTPSQTGTFTNKHVCKVSKRMMEAAEYAAEEQSYPQKELSVDQTDDNFTKLNNRLNMKGVACDTSLATLSSFRQKLTSPMSAKFSRIGLKSELSFQIRDKGMNQNQIEKQPQHQRNKSDHNIGTPQERRLKQQEQATQLNEILYKQKSTKNPSASRDNQSMIQNQCLLKLNTIDKSSVIKDYAEKIEPYKNNFVTPKQQKLLLNLQGKSYSSQLTETVFSSQVPLPNQNLGQNQKNVYEEINCLEEPQKIRARGQSEYSVVQIADGDKRNLNNNIYKQVPIKSQFSVNSNSGSSKNVLSKQSERTQSGTKRSSFSIRYMDLQNQSSAPDQTMFQDIPVSKKVIEEQEKKKEEKEVSNESHQGKEDEDNHQQGKYQNIKMEQQQNKIKSNRKFNESDDNYNDERFEEYFSDEEEEKKGEKVIENNFQKNEQQQSLGKIELLQNNRRQSENKNIPQINIQPLRSASSKPLAISKSNSKVNNQLELKSMLQVKSDENKQSMIANANQSRLESLRQRCRQNMGEYFDKVYAIIQKAINQNLQKYKMKQMLVEIVGKDRINDCFEVEMLIYQEEEERNKRK